jgi:hypothetical protein
MEMSKKRYTKHHLNKMASSKKIFIASIVSLILSWAVCGATALLRPEAFLKLTWIINMDNVSSVLFMGLVLTSAISLLIMIDKLSQNASNNFLMWSVMALAFWVTKGSIQLTLSVTLAFWIFGTLDLFISARKVLMIETQPTFQRNVKTEVFDSLYSWPGGFGFIVGRYAFQWRQKKLENKSTNKTLATP